MKGKTQFIFYGALTGVVLISFFLYSSRFYALLSSDDALNILIAHYYKLPQDFYCWGQDRGGTLIPLISQIFIRLFNCSAVTAVSFSNYLILILGYIGFSSLIKSRYYKLIFAIFWFLPFDRFIGLLRFPIGVQYSLLAVIILLINNYGNSRETSVAKKHLLLGLMVLTGIAAVWASDLAMVSIGILLVVLVLFSFLKNSGINLNKLGVFYTVLGTVLCFLFIHYAKSYAILKNQSYMSFNSFSDIGKAFKLLMEAWWNVLTFRTSEPLITIYTYLIIAFLVVLFAVVIKQKVIRNLLFSRWIAFFLLDFIGVFVVIMLSSWVLINAMNRSYFVATYISLSILIFLVLDKIPKGKASKFFKYGILIIALIGAVSPLYTMKYIMPKSLTPMVDVVGEFKRLGEIGVVAEYWNAYITSCPDPDLIKAVQHDENGYTRNQELVDMVFERENIYVIKDNWLNSFPDTLEQFGYILVKTGREFSIGGSIVCKYQKIKLNVTFYLPQLNVAQNVPVIDSISGRKVLFAPANCESCREKHILYGPYMPLGIGEFTVNFNLKASDFKTDKPIAVVEVTADNGETPLAHKEISKKDFADSDFIDLALAVKTEKRYRNVEFRVYFYGRANLWFHHVHIREN